MADAPGPVEGAPELRLSDLRLPLRRLPRLLRDPLTIVDDAARGRDVVRLRLGPRSVYVVNEPRLIQQVLEDEAGAFARFGPEATTEQKLAGASVALLDGDVHARRRHAIEAVFEAEAMTSCDRGAPPGAPTCWAGCCTASWPM
jgi:cytochrome P450